MTTSSLSFGESWGEAQKSVDFCHTPLFIEFYFRTLIFIPLPAQTQNLFQFL